MKSISTTWLLELILQQPLFTAHNKQVVYYFWNEFWKVFEG